EGLVFAARIADDLVRELPAAAEPAIDERDAGLLAPQALVGVQAAMTVGAGVLRSADSLAATAAALARIGGRGSGSDERSVDLVEPCVEAWQATNVHTVASALVTGAQLRAETRGCHWREDFPRASDAWLGHLVTQLSPDGTPSTSFYPAPEAAFQPAATS
ncbi:MAG: L-aspartate oxidase, partial [Actinomycetota bacterium]|nr:L-aspartate oxidase [Actinomycetota bacterium]